MRRQCLVCSDEGIGPKSLDEFGTDRRGPGGKHRLCLVHANAYALRSYHRNAADSNARRAARRRAVPIELRPYDRKDRSKAMEQSARYRQRVKLGLVVPKRRVVAIESSDAIKITS